MRWGVETATFDREGAVTATSDVRPEAAAIAQALKAFVGEIGQIPPNFSAVKVDGARAYDLAREGVEMDLQPRLVTIHDARLVDVPDADHAVIEIECGKGTYVRALAPRSRRRAGNPRPCLGTPPHPRRRLWRGQCDNARKNSKRCAMKGRLWRFYFRSRPPWTTSRSWP